jgi:hypothetical protein
VAPAVLPPVFFGLIAAAFLIPSFVRFLVFVFLEAPLLAVVQFLDLVTVTIAHALLVGLVFRVILVLKWSCHRLYRESADTNDRRYRYHPNTMPQVHFHKKRFPFVLWTKHADSRRLSLGGRSTSDIPHIIPLLAPWAARASVSLVRSTRGIGKMVLPYGLILAKDVLPDSNVGTGWSTEGTSGRRRA